MSLEERLDTSSAAGELVFHVFGASAHFEQRLLSERTHDGITAASKRVEFRPLPDSTPDTNPVVRDDTVRGVLRWCTRSRACTRAPAPARQWLLRSFSVGIRNSVPSKSTSHARSGGEGLDGGLRVGAPRRGSTRPPPQCGTSNEAPRPKAGGKCRAKHRRGYRNPLLQRSPPARRRGGSDALSTVEPIRHPFFNEVPRPKAEGRALRYTNDGWYTLASKLEILAIS